jgi:dTDP-4-amino-4,6-dideoxygalactose transaminase
MSGKHHATGAQGGVVFTKDEQLYWETKRFADRGKPFGLEGRSNVRLGLNLNLNDLSAAIGRVQLRKLPGIVARRRRAVQGIVDGLADAGAVGLGWQPAGSEASYWFLRLQLDLEKLKVTKEQFCAAVSAEGIPCTPSYNAIPAEFEWFAEQRTYGNSRYPWSAPEYRGDRHPHPSLPNAHRAVESCFLIHVHENFGDKESRDIAEALLKVEKAYRR